MTGDARHFRDLELKRGGKVTFGDNSQGRILGQGSIGKPFGPSFSNVLLVGNLKHNLLSISQLCDSINRVIFEPSFCFVESISDQKLLFVGIRKENIYSVNLNNSTAFHEVCFSALESNVEFIWHRRLGHASLSRIAKLARLGLARGLPKLRETKEFVCRACSLGKQTKTSFKSKTCSSFSLLLQLLHLDLFGPSNVMSLGGKYYTLVVVDDYSRFTWVSFLTHKHEALCSLCSLLSIEETQLSLNTKAIRSDHGGEFDSTEFHQFCSSRGIKHEFSAPRTLQQNGVVERKNRALIDLARTMLADFNTPTRFWAEAVATACYVLNRTLIRPDLNKTPYELVKHRTPKLSYFHPFGCKCYVLNTKDNLGKFDSRSCEAIFLGYSDRSKAYRIFNLKTKKVEESVHIIFYEKTPDTSVDISEPSLVFTLGDSETSIPSEVTPVDSKNFVPLASNPDSALIPSSVPSPSPEISSSSSVPQAPPHIAKRHPSSLIIGDPSQNLVTRSKRQLDFNGQAFLSKIEPRSIKEALLDEHWIAAMQEELTQFERSEVWDLVPAPLDKFIIGTKWVFRNKTDDDGTVVHNKARLVAQGYNQEEGIDFDETFALLQDLRPFISCVLLLAIEASVCFRWM
ncbi:Retrovirus-related Pol polyprotein from transposon TNT 1-94 [Linum perenne]